MDAWMRGCVVRNVKRVDRVARKRKTENGKRGEEMKRLHPSDLSAVV